MTTEKNRFNVSHERLIQWWALLNAHKTPTDLPKEDEEKLFNEIRKLISSMTRYAFWNGEFGQGRNADKFIDP